MKNLSLLLVVLLFLSACQINVVEPVYDPRDRVIGHYRMEEYSETYNDVTYYTISISKSGESSEIYLNNFYALDLSVYAYLNGDKITIPQQVIEGYRISGVGTYWGREITLNYSVKDLYEGTITDYCESTARRN
jgi:hypothetical protein